MLMLTRRPGDGLTLQTSNGEIHIVCDLNNGQVKLAIDAPEAVLILRDELWEREDQV